MCSALHTPDHPLSRKPLKESLRRAICQTLTVSFACAAKTFSALSASICPCIFSSPSNGGEGDDERVVNTDDTAADDTAVLGVDNCGTGVASGTGVDVNWGR